MEGTFHAILQFITFGFGYGWPLHQEEGGINHNKREVKGGGGRWWHGYLVSLIVCTGYLHVSSYREVNKVETRDETLTPSLEYRLKYTTSTFIYKYLYKQPHLHSSKKPPTQIFLVTTKNSLESTVVSFHSKLTNGIAEYL